MHSRAWIAFKIKKEEDRWKVRSAAIQGYHRRERREIERVNICSAATHLTLRVLVRLDTVANLCHGLLDHRHTIRSLSRWVDAFLRHLRCDISRYVRKVVGAFLLADLQFALLQDLPSLSMTGSED